MGISMKFIVSVLLAFLFVFPSDAAVTPPSSDLITMSKEQMMQLQQMFQGIEARAADSHAAAEYWFLKYEELKQCIMDNPDTASTSCLDTL